MNSEIVTNPDWKLNKSTNSKLNRKIYTREDFFRFYNCCGEIPDYLKDFQYLYNNFTEENWCKKPIPKFDEIPDNKGKSTNLINKAKGRQRTLSNPSGENDSDVVENFGKNRNSINNGKFNRFGNPTTEKQPNEEIKKEINTTFINSKDFEDNPETNWQKVESKTSRIFNSSKPYAQTFQLSENHWKKWSKDRNLSGDKTRPQNVPYNKSDKSTWIRRNENDTKPRNTKVYGRHSVSKSGDQTEDIWQDDWDTEMKSEIAKDDEILYNSFELPKSSVLPATPPSSVSEPKITIPIFDVPPPDTINSGFDMWFYRDLSDNKRGPFSSENMANWLATGYFNPSTFVRRMCDERFLLLAEYRALYGRIPFTVGPTIPPIYINTPIEIDIQKLLIGVDATLIQKVINCATCIPKIIQPQIALNNTNRQEEISTDERMAILEEKQKIEESRLELERERERMIQEQIQWRARMEAEMHAKLEAMFLKQTIANSLQIETPVSQYQLLPQEEPVELEQPSFEEMVHVVENITLKNESEISTLKEMVITQSEDQLEIDVSQIVNIPETNHWFSTKEIKQQKKNKKSKNKEMKSSKEEQEVVLIPEAKHPDQPTDSRISIVSRESILSATQRETPVESKGRPIRFELDNRKIESQVSWTSPPVSIATPSTSTGKSILDIQVEELKDMKAKEVLISLALNETESANISGKPIRLDSEIRKADLPVSWSSLASTNVALPVAPRSIKEIQAEESEKEKRQQQLINVVKAHEIELNKVTSFKESLLKSAKVVKPVLMPVGKSIWDVLPAEPPVTKTSIEVSKQAPVTKNVELKTEKNNSVKKNVDPQPDQLTLWCTKKLGKFSEKFDVLTVIELLRQVPNEEVMELALQLIDDSKFTSSFVVEFINKRQELSDKQVDDTWQKVKKPIVVAPVAAPSNNSKSSKSAKSKSKKKMVVIDAKFR